MLCMRLLIAIAARWKAAIQKLSYHKSMYVLGSRLPLGMRVKYSLNAYKDYPGLSCVMSLVVLKSV